MNNFSSRILAASFLSAALAFAPDVIGAESPSPAGPSHLSNSAVTSSAPAGETDRFVIPSWSSIITSGTTRSATVIAIYNNSTATCHVSVRFQYPNSSGDLCLMDVAVAPHTASTFCTRLPSSYLYSCDQTCSSPLTFHTGKAYIASTNTTASCAHLTVDAQVYFTSDTADKLLVSTSKLTVSKAGNGTAGD